MEQVSYTSLAYSAHRDRVSAKHMTTIKTLSNQGEAAFLLSVLRANGFDAVLLDEGSFHYNAILSSMRLQVPDAQATAALNFLNKTPEPGCT